MVCETLGRYSVSFDYNSVLLILLFYNFNLFMSYYIIYIENWIKSINCVFVYIYMVQRVILEWKIGNTIDSQVNLIK